MGLAWYSAKKWNHLLKQMFSLSGAGNKWQKLKNKTACALCERHGTQAQFIDAAGNKITAVLSTQDNEDEFCELFKRTTCNLKDKETFVIKNDDKTHVFYLVEHDKKIFVFELENEVMDLYQNMYFADLEKIGAHSKMQTKHIRIMSHEVRTPIHSIKGALELLNMTELSEKQSQYINVIDQSADNVLKIMNDVLEHSKIETGNVSINKEPCNIFSLMEKVMMNFFHIADNKMLDFVLCINFSMPEIISIDELRVQQVIWNLISNAIKFTDQGVITVNVDIEERNNERHLVIQVIDTGVGIKEGDEEFLFEPFYQDREHPNYHDGAGLGLPISKKIARQLAGDITVSSNSGHGSIFSFNFPIHDNKTGTLENMDYNAPDSNALFGLNVALLIKHDGYRKCLENLITSMGGNVSYSGVSPCPILGLMVTPPDIVITMDQNCIIEGNLNYLILSKDVQENSVAINNREQVWEVNRYNPHYVKDFLKRLSHSNNNNE